MRLRSLIPLLSIELDANFAEVIQPAISRSVYSGAIDHCQSLLQFFLQAWGHFCAEIVQGQPLEKDLF